MISETSTDERGEETRRSAETQPAAAEPGEPLPRRRSPWTQPRNRILVALVALLLLGFLVPPFVNINRFRSRIVHSMEATLGRRVTVESVGLRLLPQPGFELHKLSIGDDPAFGAEPMLQADEVTAAFRWSSLWRGRLEVASLSLQSGPDSAPPSLNLVRAPDGRWNLGALLHRGTQMPTAPTATARAESRPRFPYIEADGGRINFKLGLEKKVYVLTDADFSLWLASENEWAFRLSARALRTDLNLSDTGVLKINGRFRRAPELRETPLDLDLSLRDAQLGALTRLIYGRDKGWRATVAIEAHLAGTPNDLGITARSALHDFRRYDINTVDNVALQSQCLARYSSASDQLSEINCQAPLGSGLVRVRGNLEGLLEPRAFELELAAENVDVQTLATLARHMKQDLPEDLSAQGDLNTRFTVSRSAGADSWSGAGRTTAIRLTSAALSPALTLPPVDFAFAGPDNNLGIGNSDLGTEKQHPRSRAKARVHDLKPQIPNPQSQMIRLVLAPFPLDMGAPAPMAVSAWFSRHDYEVRLHGDASISRLLLAGRAAGLRVPAYTAEGKAGMDLQIAGTWAGFSAPEIYGAAQLRDVSVPVAGLNAPLQIPAGELQLGPAEASLQHMTMRFSLPGLQPAMEFKGSARLPRYCGSAGRCPLAFDLQSDQISFDELNALLNPRLARAPWYDVFPSRVPVSGLLRINASGQLSAGRLLMKSVAAQHLVADLRLQEGQLALTNVRADVLGGKYSGDWHADFTQVQPQYSGNGAFSDLAMSQLGALMHDDWAGGGLSGTYRVVTSGYSAAQLSSGLSGAAEFDWRDGVLRHVVLNDRPGPLRFNRLRGDAEWRDGMLKIPDSHMTLPDGNYEVSGTASMGRDLLLTLQNDQRVYNISGSLEKPRVAQALPAAREARTGLRP